MLGHVEGLHVRAEDTDSVSAGRGSTLWALKSVFWRAHFKKKNTKTGIKMNVNKIGKEILRNYKFLKVGNYNITTN